MADVTGMFRRGEISSRQAGKLGILKQTRVNRPNEEEFHGKQGRRDQGRGREHGAREATTRHIDTKQDMGSKARASGQPAGFAKGFTKQPTRRDHIDAAALEKPDFPRGAGVLSGKAAKGVVPSRPPGGGKPAGPMAKGYATPRRVKAPIPPQGGQYGGGGRNTQ